MGIFPLKLTNFPEGVPLILEDELCRKLNAFFNFNL